MDEYAASIPFDYLLHEYEQYENDRAMIRSIKPSAILILFYTIIIAIARIKLYTYTIMQQEILDIGIILKKKKIYETEFFIRKCVNKIGKNYWSTKGGRGKKNVHDETNVYFLIDIISLFPIPTSILKYFL